MARVLLAESTAVSGDFIAGIHFIAAMPSRYAPMASRQPKSLTTKWKMSPSSILARRWRRNALRQDSVALEFFDDDLDRSSPPF